MRSAPHVSFESREPHNPFAVPQSDVEGTDIEDPGALEPSLVTRYGSAASFIAGTTSLALGIQTFANSIVGWISAVAGVMVVLGVAVFISGGWIMRMRGVGAILGLAGNALLSLGGAAWLVVSFGGGYFSLLALVLPPISFIAALFAGAAIPVTRRADRVRAKLMSF